MKNLILIFSLMLGLSACGGGSGDGAKSTNGQPLEVQGGRAGAVTTVGPGVVLTPGTAVNTPYSTGRSFAPEATLGAEFSKDSTGLVSLVQGDLQTSQPFGYGQDCFIPAGSYSLSTKQGGQQASKEHHYQGIVINAVGPVSFTATVTNLSAKDFMGVWRMQGIFSVSTVGNRSCTGYGLPIELRFTFQ